MTNDYKQPDEPEQPAAPGAADLTPEQIAAALNARKWRGRGDWADCGGVHASIWVGSPLLPMADWLAVEDARAIVRSFEMEAARAYWTGRAMKAQDEIAAWERELQRVRSYSITEIEALQHRVASLTTENKQLRADIAKVCEDTATTLATLTAQPSAPQPRSIPYEPWLLTRLQDPESLIGYLEAALEANDWATVRLAVQDCINALRVAGQPPAQPDLGK